MLNQDKPKDYLLASGETHSVREFVELAFHNAGIQGYWSGEGVDEVYKLRGEVPVDITLMKVNRNFYRPAEVDLLLGDPSEAEKELGWRKKIDFETLVCRMCEHDFKEINAT
jgi:GDPmannose 4,6-dehydratase